VITFVRQQEISLLIGVVSDVHGNSAALLRAMELVGPVDEWICLGDCISEYRFSNEVVALLRDRGFITIHGNHEEVFFSRLGERTRSASWIDKGLMDWLGSQPRSRVLEREGKELLLVHSTPWHSGGQYVCAHDPDFQRFGETTADIVLYGHTHRPVVQRARNTLVVNPGSVGEPGAGAGELSCAVLNVTQTDASIIRFCS
jgi:putative phosphoesterase